MAAADARPKGYEIGSTYIDGGFQLLAKSLLEPFASRLGRSIDDVAWELRNTVQFQIVKHDFEPNSLVDTKFPVPHLEGSHIVLCVSVQSSSESKHPSY